MRCLEKGSEQLARRGKQRFAGTFLFVRAAALADAEIEIDEGVFRQPVGDGVVIGLQGAHPDGADLEEAGFQHRFEKCHAERVKVGAAFQIGRIFDGEMRHCSSRHAIFYLTC